jgi:DNA-binding GntR family transcriptional regulator
MEQTLAEKSYDYIRKKLAGGDLPLGQRLVNRVLADEIGGSVIPVREAIHRLASEGLVEHVPGSGAFVRKTDPHDLDNLYVLRDALESCAAGVAAQTCSGKRDLIEALRHRDHQRARKLMSEQVQRGRKQVLRHLRSAARP